MNAADILILAILALSVLAGLLSGFVVGLLSLVCWVAAFWVAWAFGHQVALMYGSWLHDPAACIIAGYVTCFLGVIIVGAVAGWAARHLLDSGGLRGGDRFLGMLFGLARGLVLVTFAVLMLGFTPLPREAAWWRGSTLLPLFEDGAGWAATRLPPGVTRYFEIGGKSLGPLSKVPISALQRTLSHDQEPAAQAQDAERRARTSSTQRVDGQGPRRGDMGQ